MLVIAIALHALRGGVAVPARQHHDGRAAVDRAVQAALHAGRRGTSAAPPEVILAWIAPNTSGARRPRAHHAAVRVHAALRAPGGARGVGHHAQVVGPVRSAAPAQLLASSMSCHMAVPARRLRKRPPRRGDEVGNARSVGASGSRCRWRRSAVRSAVPPTAAESARTAPARRRPLLAPLSSTLCAQLLREVHRVDRHDHRVGAQDAVVGQHELRAVLHVEQHPVARATRRKPAADSRRCVRPPAGTANS